MRKRKADPVFGSAFFLIDCVPLQVIAGLQQLLDFSDGDE
jgi:hypothetical protein